MFSKISKKNNNNNDDKRQSLTEFQKITTIMNNLNKLEGEEIRKKTLNEIMAITKNDSMLPDSNNVVTSINCQKNNKNISYMNQIEEKNVENHYPCENNYDFGNNSSIEENEELIKPKNKKNFTSLSLFKQLLRKEITNNKKTIDNDKNLKTFKNPLFNAINFTLKTNELNNGKVEYTVTMKGIITEDHNKLINNNIINNNL